MKTKTIIFTIAVAIFTSMIIESCNSAADDVTNAEQKVTDANEALNAANEAYLADIEAYRTETAVKITANDSTILAFKTQMKKDKKAANKAYDERLAELEQENADLKMKMENYNGEGEDKWEEFKKNFSNDMDNWRKAFKDLSGKK